MLDPVSMHNQILGNIIARVPGMQDMLSSMEAARRPRVSPVEASNETTNTYAGRESGSTSPAAAVHTSFDELLRQFAAANRSPDPVRQSINDAITDAAREFNLDPNLIKAVTQAESSFRPNVVSHAGAMGLMQLMPGTADMLGVTDPFDIRQNIWGGANYLRQMLDLFDGNEALALAAYNAGPGAVQRHGGIPPFEETINFVPRVQDFRSQFILQQYKNAIRLATS